MRRYIVGNTVAVLIGLVSAYVALRFSGLANAQIIDIRSVDLLEYMSVGRLIRIGHGGSIYSWPALYASQNALVGRSASTAAGTLAFLYPPAWALIFVPLSAIPYSTAYVIWISVNGIALMAALYELERLTGLTGARATAFRWASLTFLPVLLALVLGQVSILLLAALTLALHSLRSASDAVAGWCLALACFKPTYIAPIILLLLVRRSWTVLSAFAAAALLLILLPVPFLGLSIYSSYFRMLKQVASWQGRSIDHPFWFQGVPIPTGTYAPQWNHSLAGFAELAARGRVAPILLYGILGACVVLLMVWFGLRTDASDIPFALAVIAGLLVSPHTLAYDYTLMLLPTAVALRYRAYGRRMLVCLLPLLYLLAVLGVWLAFAIKVQTTVLAGAILAVWLVWAGIRPPASAAAPPRITQPRRGVSPDLS